jgi:hypothetical protein
MYEVISICFIGVSSLFFYVDFYNVGLEFALGFDFT